ncbi:hypothetical protein AK812_SmicGene22564 [Symbiodinium microadriaticum]|uniref:Uncharacterized protein n=1 Tax=Symbiodinium microadriaticum TaxID=2951 RepID=A0A1Q9DJJ4_SYMMI|nr:hypothetical protein AK812_SmicGene22564 [Symbiodinium microadriaticum]
MVGADAELPFSVRTLPDLAELVHRKLHLGAGGIAQIVQTKTRMPRRRTQESFVYGTASVHAELLMPPRVVLSAVLSEQAPVKLISFVAGSRRSVVCALNHAGRRGRRNAMNMLCSTSVAIQVSGSTRPHIGDVIPPSAAPAAAPVCFMLRCRNGSSWWQGHFIAAQSRHHFVSGQESKQSFVDHAIVDAIPHNCAVRQARPLQLLHFRRPQHQFVFSCGAGSTAKLLPDASCVAALLTGAIEQALGWIRPPLASAHAIPPDAASSVRPAAAPVCHASLCASQEPVFQEDFTNMTSGLLRFLTQTGAISRPGIEFLPRSFVSMFSFSAGTSSTKYVGDSSRAAALTNSRAIAQVSGCIHTFLACAWASPSSAASSLPPAAAPVCFFLQCRNGSSWWQGHFRAAQSRHQYVSGQESKQSLVDHAIVDAIPHKCAVRSSPTAVGCFAMQVHESSCTAGLLTKSRALVPVWGWIRPPVASAHAPPPAASSLRPAAAPVCRFLHCRYRGCFRGVESWHLVVDKQGGMQSFVDLAIADSVPYSSAVRSSPAATGSKPVCNASRVAALLTISRAIAQASGWIRPPATHHQLRHNGREGLIGVHSGKLFVLVPSRCAHESSSKQANHSIRCMRFQELVHGAGTAAWHSLRSVQAARKNYAVLRSSRCASRMWPPPVMAEPSPKKVGMPPPPSPTPRAACMLRLQGAVRSVFRPDIEAAVESFCLEISPVEETLRQAQLPFILMIRNLLPLLPSQALQDREVPLNLVLVGHSHGGVIAHSMAQCLESAGFLVKGIVAVDTLALPRWTEMPLPRFDPRALARHLSPCHWQLTVPKVNMMAPEVPPFRRMLPSRAELLAGGAVFPPKYVKDVDHFRILQQSSWDLAAVVSRILRRHFGQPNDRRIRLSDNVAVKRGCPDCSVRRPPTRSDPQPQPRQHPQESQSPHQHPPPQQQHPPLCAYQPRPRQLHPAAFRQLPPAPPWALPHSTVRRPLTDHPRLLYASPPPPPHARAFAPHPPKYPSYLSSPQHHLHLSGGTTPQPQACTPSSCSVPCGAPPRGRLASPRPASPHKPRFLI